MAGSNPSSFVGILGRAEAITKFKAAQEAILHAVEQAVKKATLDCEGHAKANAPVDTGFLKSSIYSELHASSDYGNADAPPAGADLLPEVDKPKDAHTGIVAVGASYGAFVELGTVHAAAQPFLGPALDAVRPGFDAALEKLEAQLAALSAL